MGVAVGVGIGVGLLEALGVGLEMIIVLAGAGGLGVLETAWGLAFRMPKPTTAKRTPVPTPISSQREEAEDDTFERFSLCMPQV